MPVPQEFEKICAVPHLLAKSELTQLSQNLGWCRTTSCDIFRLQSSISVQAPLKKNVAFC